MIPTNTDLTTEGLALLPMQLQGKERLEALLEVLLDQVQELEEALYPLLSERALPVASGGTLDQLGRLVGESRQARSDADYRAAIGLRIERNNSRGEADRLIRVLRKLTGATHVAYSEPWPGVVQLVFDGQSIPTDLRAAMEAIAPVGVRLLLIQAPPDAFAFSEVAHRTLPSDARGFSNTLQQWGGGISKII